MSKKDTKGWYPPSKTSVATRPKAKVHRLRNTVAERGGYERLEQAKTRTDRKGLVLMTALGVLFGLQAVVCIAALVKYLAG